MPYLIDIPLALGGPVLSDAVVPRHQVHAAVTGALGEGEHRGRTKPFSVWPLVLSQWEAVLRVGWLTDEPPVRLLSRRQWWFGRIEGQTLGPHMIALPWNELMAARPARRVDWQFASPTTFQRGDANYPLPDPRLMIESLARRWNTFCPHVRLENQLVVDLARAVEPDRLRIHDEPFDPPHRHLRGFVGDVGWRLIPGTSPDLGCMLNAMASFARVAGVGYLTTQGYGSCRTKIDTGTASAGPRFAGVPSPVTQAAAADVHR